MYPGDFTPISVVLSKTFQAHFTQFPVQIFSRRIENELMKDVFVYDQKISVGQQLRTKYKLEIEDVNRLNLRRYQCRTPANDVEMLLNSQGLHAKCLSDCRDEIINRIPCNCTRLNAFNSSLRLLNCQYYTFRDLGMQNFR